MGYTDKRHINFRVAYSKVPLWGLKGIMLFLIALSYIIVPKEGYVYVK